MNSALIIWLWGQWKKYINYFIKNNYEVVWVCRTLKTQKYIEYKYWIRVHTDYKSINYYSFDIIIVCLPPTTQWEISLDILQRGYTKRMIIEIPVTWDKNILKKIQEFKNAHFFLEEYFTILSQFLRKVKINFISNICINVICSEKDFYDEKAKKVTDIHVRNNFLGTNLIIPKYIFSFHSSEDIFYEISFLYIKTQVKYVFSNKKYLQIGEKIIDDNYNFDTVLDELLQMDNNVSDLYKLS